MENKLFLEKLQHPKYHIKPNAIHSISANSYRKKYKNTTEIWLHIKCIAKDTIWFYSTVICIELNQETMISPKLYSLYISMI